MELDFEYNDVKQPHKRGGRVYKYHEQRHRVQVRYPTIEKFVIDPANDLSKNKRNKLIVDVSDGMKLGVLYSANKQARFKLTADSFLPGKQRKDMDVAFVNHTHVNRYRDLASSVSFLNEDDSVSTAYPLRYSSRDQSLLEKASGKTTKELKSKPRLEYIVHSIHPIVKRMRRDLIYRTQYNNLDHWWMPYKREKLGAKNDQYFDERDFDDRERVEEEEEEKRERREFMLNLDDCLQTPSTSQRAEKRQRRRRNTEDDFEIVDQSSFSDTSSQSNDCKNSFHFNMQKYNGFFEEILIEKEKWEGSSLEKEIAFLNTDEYTVHWLNNNRTRVTIDASRALSNDDSLSHPTIVITVEETKNGSKRFTINSTISSPSPEEHYRLLQNISTTRNLNNFVNTIVENFEKWKQKQSPSSRSLTSSDCLTSRFTRRPYLFSQQVNSSLHSEEAVLRKIEQTEILETVGNDFDFSQCSDIQHGREIQKQCGSCGNEDQFELFLMANSYSCRTCLRQLIIRKIRTSKIQDVKISLPEEGTNLFNVLPLFIPLSIIGEYTEYLVLKAESEKSSKIGSKILKCPGCTNLLEISCKEQKVRITTISCPICHIHFCAHCAQNGHFPMNCEENLEWMELFDTQVAIARIPSDKLKAVFLRITCECGGLIETPENFPYAQCPSCSLEIHPKCLRLVHPRPHPFVENSRRTKQIPPKKYFAFFNRGVERVFVKKTIDNKYAKLAIECHLERLDLSKTENFTTSIRLLLKGSYYSLHKAVELRKAVLSLIENTLGMLFINETFEEEEREIMKMLKELKKIYNDLLSLVENKDVIGDKLKELEKSYFEIVDYLSSHQ